MKIFLKNYLDNYNGYVFELLVEYEHSNDFSKQKCIFEINQEFITRLKQWQHELKTTEKKQGHCRLLHENRYCCLGILGNLFLEEFDKFICDAQFLSDADFKKCLPLISIYNAEDYFQFVMFQLNDVYNLSFAEIADILQDFIDFFEQANNKSIPNKMVLSLEISH